MSVFRPFFDLLQRPLVLFGAIGWMIIATFLIGQLVRQGGDPEFFMDADFLTVTVLSAYAGWLTGSCILEFHQSTVAWPLPAGGNRLLWGFLTFASLVVLAAVLLVNAASPATRPTALLFVFGMGVFASGATIRDPQSRFLTGLGIALLLLLLITSGTQAQIAEQYPLLLLSFSLVLIAVGLYRLFHRAAVRRRSVERGRPVLVFSAAEIGKAAQRGETAYGPVKRHWRQGYLGDKTALWVKAAWYEAHGGARMRYGLRVMAGSWGLFLVLFLEARLNGGDLGYWRSVWWVLYDGLMRAPTPPVTGERSGLFLMVGIFIAIAGATLAFWRPVALSEKFLHPLSRRDRADLMFVGSFIDMAILLCILVPLLFLLGHGAGLLAGVQPRFDYLPYFLRVLLVTLALMPLAYLGGLRMRSQWESEPYSMVGVSLGMAVFGAVVMGLVFFSESAFRSASNELIVLIALLLASRPVFYGWLQHYYQTTDLG